MDATRPRDHTTMTTISFNFMKTAASMNKRKRSPQAGFGLIETMFSMALLITIMTAAFLFLDQVMARFQMARDH